MSKNLDNYVSCGIVNQGTNYQIITVSDTKPTLPRMAKAKKTKIIGASSAMSRRTYPQGLPEALVVRGTGRTLMDKLATMDEVAEDLVGVIIIHVDADQQSLLGPELLLRGPSMTLGLKVKAIWGEVS